MHQENGGEIVFPSEVTLDLHDRGGSFAVTVIARDGAMLELARGVVQDTVTRKSTLVLSMTLSRAQGRGW